MGKNITRNIIIIGIVWISCTLVLVIREYITSKNLGVHSLVEKYNNAYHLSLSGDIMTAHAYLEDILLMSPTEYREKIYELYGDVLYLSSGSHDDVKKLYTVALSGSDNPRIQQKLQYLDATGSYLGQSEKTLESQNISVNSPLTGSLSESLSQIGADTKKLDKYIYPPNGIPRGDTERLSEIRSFLEEGVEREDW